MLRDMSEAELLDAYQADRFTLTILSSRFRHIVDYDCVQLISNAFSEIIRDYSDMSGALAGPPDLDFPTIAVAQTLPVLRLDGRRGSGFASRVRRRATIARRSHRGQRSISRRLIRPGFYGPKLIGALTIRAHMLDWGGSVVGGFEPTKANLYVDGLCLRRPPSMPMMNR